MPDRILWEPLRAWQLFVRLQLPFVVGLVLLTLAAVLATPAVTLGGRLLSGAILAVAASLAFLFDVGSWLSTRWVIVIPVVDIVALAFVRADLVAYIPVVGMLCLFPFAWIAYRFPWPALLVVFAGGVFIAALPYLTGTTASDTTPLALLNVIALPLIATGISIGIHLGAAEFRRGREAVQQSTAQLRSALESARDQELVLRSVLNTVNGGVAFYDAHNRLQFANVAAENMVATVGFRLDAPPYAGDDVRMQDRKTPIPYDQQIIPRALRGEVIASHIEWLGTPGDQSAILASAERVHRPDGELLGTVIAAYDVTELADAIQIREDFLTSVSHELRTPLTSIVGYTDYVTEVLGDDAERLGVASALSTIERNAETLLERVSHLLNAADRGIRLDVAPTDLATDLRRTADRLAVAAQRRGVSWVVRLPPRLPATLDAARVAQATENLLTNALKFTPRGGTVTVEAGTAPDGEVRIAVSDTGIGMSADDQRQVFDRFYRARAVRENAVQGIGIGLSIVKEIVDAHGGEISIESSPGAGTTFILRFPQHS